MSFNNWRNRLFWKSSLLNIAFECGFNSASSFHRACVKYTGKSPRDLRQELLSNIELREKVNEQEI
nr:helix-turn-helix domain-containing protein [Leptospira sp. severe_002]